MSTRRAKVHVLPSKNGKFYYHMKAPNGQILVTSEIYEDHGKARRGAITFIGYFSGDLPDLIDEKE